MGKTKNGEIFTNFPTIVDSKITYTSKTVASHFDTIKNLLRSLGLAPCLLKSQKVNFAPAGTNSY